MSEERFRPFAAVYMMLIKDNHVFLIRRYQTGWQDGSYGLPSGHMEGGEKVIDAARRETQEEVGVTVAAEDVSVVHVMHRIRVGEREYVDFYCATEKWEGEPSNCEPDKCDDAQWFPLDALPEKIIPSVRTAIENSQKAISFSEFGWDGQA